MQEERGFFFFFFPFTPVCVPHSRLLPTLQGEKPEILSIPSPWAWWSPFLSAFWHILESQQHSASWCPTTRFIISILYRRSFSKSGGLLPATSWLFFSCVLFYTGQCHGFLPVYCLVFRYSSPWDWQTREQDTLPHVDKRGDALVYPSSPRPHTCFYFLFQPSV